MNIMALLGILCLLYAAVVIFIAVKKPPALWQMAKIQMFVKLMGDQGTVIFFYVFAAIAACLGIWLLIL